MQYRLDSHNGIIAKDINIRHTVESAQPLTFLADYDFDNGILEYTSGGRHALVGFRNTGEHDRFAFGNAHARRDFMERFRLNDRMDEIYSNISTDKFMADSVRKYRGMRVTLNDPWETTACFIMSQYNNVKRIRLIMRNLIWKYGSDITNRDGIVIARGFPTPEALSKVSEKELRAAGTGFRARYIKEAAETCSNNMLLHKMKGKSYDSIKDSLMGMNGIGEKVADCIALMGFGKTEAFPIDVWVKRTLERVYFNGKPRRIEELRDFVNERWGKAYRGYAQQYLFWGGRNLG